MRRFLICLFLAGCAARTPVSDVSDVTEGGEQGSSATEPLQEGT